jgi:hypothetical protein
MNDLGVLVFEIEVRDFESRDSLERQEKSLVDVRPASLAAQLPSELPQRTEHLRAIEALPCTVFAEIHRGVHVLLQPISDINARRQNRKSFNNRSTHRTTSE